MIKFISSRMTAAGATALAAVFTLGLLPVAASAQAYPPYAEGSSGSETIQGTIASINSTFNMTVDDSRGFADNVELHQGTVINPTGLTLEPGMNVTISGYSDGDQFDAMVIDTPYEYSGAPPIPVYYGPGWWYPGFAYGYGPSFSLVIGGGGIVREPWAGHWFVSRPVAGYRVGTPYRPGIGAYRPAERYAAPAGRAPSAYRAEGSYRAPVANRSGFADRSFAERGPSFAQRGGGFAQRGPSAPAARSGGYSRSGGGYARGGDRR